MAFSPKVDIRRRILDVTRQLLIAQGITQLSIRMIAREVGCSVGTIYFHFESKDKLIHDLIDEGFTLLVSEQEKLEKAHVDPLERLTALCRNYIDFGMRNAEYYEVMFMLKPERMARYPAEKYRSARRSIDVLARALRDCADKKLLSIENDYLSANLIWSFMHGVVSLLQVKRIDRALEPAMLIQRTIDNILAMHSLPARA